MLVLLQRSGVTPSRGPAPEMGLKKSPTADAPDWRGLWGLQGTQPGQTWLQAEPLATRYMPPQAAATNQSSAQQNPHHRNHKPEEINKCTFHFIAEIPTINLTREEVSLSPASYSVSLRKQMTPH